MKTLVNFAKTFGVNVVVMEGPGFSVEVRNSVLSINNEPALRKALETNLNSDDPKDRACASEMIDIINNELS